MSSLKDFTKNKWRPSGGGGAGSIKEKWRDDFKGLNQVAGWMGMGKDQNTTQHYVPRPLQSLKDPSSFGPPPKRIHDDHQKISENVSLSKRSSESDILRRYDAGEHTKIPLPPPLPRHLPSNLNCEAWELSGATKAKPNLPPRLPPRQKLASTSPIASRPATSLENGISNLSFTNRIRADDGFKSGFDKASKLMPTSKPKSDEGFNSRSRILPPPSPTATSSSSSTTFSQKKTALKTISSLRNDSSSVSFSEAKEAASTANKFRERHGDQVKSGLQVATKINNKYGISQKFISTQDSSVVENEKPINNRNDDPFRDIMAKKRPPPPPPPPITSSKTASVESRFLSKPQPPSIPTNTKPNWSPK